MKFPLRFVILAVFICSALVAAPAQEGDPLVVERWPNALGGAYTTAFSVDFAPTGGISYQRWFGDLGLSFTGGAFADPAQDLLIQYMAFAGIQKGVYAEDFNDWLSGGLYLAGIAGVNGKVYSAGAAYGSTGALFGGGLGVGFEVVVARHFSQMIDIMYVYDSSGRLGLQFAQAFRYRY